MFPRSFLSATHRLALAALSAGLLVGCAPLLLTPASLRAPQGFDAARRAAAPDKVFFAIYTIGSDLEDDVDPEDGKPDEAVSGQLQPRGAASDDLREIVSGLQALTPAQRARVEVLVMMGGARKLGWRGTRLLDGDALVRDAADGYFGNLPDADYLEKHPQGSMTDPRMLRRFFETTRTRSAGAGTVILELAGHGASYGGMGADMNQPEATQWIALPAIGRALRDADLRGAIIAFPACTMASLEVARAVGTQFQFLVASEETMPGEGWNYQTVFARLGQDPPVPARAIARTYADSLVDDPAHQYTDYKTCSVLDLPKAAAVFPALDAWAAQVDVQDAATRAAVLDASRTRKGFGLDVPTDPPLSLDVIDYFEALRDRSPRLRAASERVAKAARAAVVHHRGDRGYDHALGVSLYPPHLRATTGDEPNYDAQVAASAGYWRVIDGLRPYLPANLTSPRQLRRRPPSSRK